MDAVNQLNRDMTAITPKSIIERHERFPDGTEQMIAHYGYMMYRKAVDDLLRMSDIVEAKWNDGAVILINKGDLNTLKSGDLCPEKMNGYGK